MADTGKGYYEMLTRRASRAAEADKPDTSLRQVVKKATKKGF